MKRTRADLIQAWLLKAHKDVVFAREALSKGEDYTDIACFHAQQAAEKTLKAYLVWLGVEFPKTHVLEDLLDLIARQDITLEDWRAALQPLTPFAVEARYPEFSLPSLAEARQAVETAERLLEFVKTLLSTNV